MEGQPYRQDSSAIQAGIFVIRALYTYQGEEIAYYHDYINVLSTATHMDRVQTQH